MNMEYLGNQKAVNRITPLVSVCVQVYNNEEFIEKCISNIINQNTTFPFEVIIGEDDSTDSTRDICKRLAEINEDKIRLFLRKEEDKIFHRGRKTSRFNFMSNLTSARGKYIALCDGDDYWCNLDKLQLQFDILENKPEFVACHHWQKNAIYKDNIWIEVESPKSLGFGYQNKVEGHVKDIFKNDLRIKARTVMFRNLITENFFPQWFKKVAFADLSLSFLLGQYGNFYFMNKEMAVYRQRPDGLSKSGLKELGINSFKVQHFKNYIEIYDYADRHYNFRYHRQATETIATYFDTIFLNTSTSLKSFFNLLHYNMFDRRLSFTKTFPNTKNIIFLFVNKFIEKTKSIFK